MLVHIIFAQAFYPANPANKDSAQERRKYKNRLYAKEILEGAIGDSNQALVNILQPLYLMVKAQDANDNTENLEKIATLFLETQISGDNFYKNKSGRYGLMIHQLIAGNPKLEQIDKKLFDSIFTPQ